MNYQSLGKELMSQDEIAVMDGSKCILQVRGVRPFLSSKYDIERHPNYKYLSDADPDKAFNIAEFVKVYKDSKAKLLAGLNKRNTQHTLIVIDDDEPPEADKKPPTPTKSTKPTETAAEQENPKPTEPDEPQATEADAAAQEAAEPPTEAPTEHTDSNTDHDEDEDDEGDFDPDDTELV
jgi:outer membrane biosynthesis protein TonB